MNISERFNWVQLISKILFIDFIKPKLDKFARLNHISENSLFEICFGANNFLIDGFRITLVLKPNLVFVKSTFLVEKFRDVQMRTFCHIILCLFKEFFLALFFRSHRFLGRECFKTNTSLISKGI